MTQKVFVGIAILVAAIYLGWQFYKRFIRKETKCESCAFGKAEGE